MKFRTEFKVPISKLKINHNHRVLMLGSCFTDNIGAHLLSHKFNVNVNPFGVLYNPFSISKILNSCLNNKLPQINDLRMRGDLNVHFDYHSSHSSVCKEQAIRNMQSAFESVNIANTDIFIFSWGTSRVYSLKETNQVVANCHKFPQDYFDREEKSVSEIVCETKQLINDIREVNENAQFVFTVSPVRYLKDGFIDSQRSKARLILAAEELTKTESGVFYFPAYELLLDDLRDYRYFDEDLVHPTDFAVEYIWNAFKASYFSEETIKIGSKFFQIVQASSHRIQFPESLEVKKFVNANLTKIERINSEYEQVDFSKEIKYFRSLLK